MSQPIEIFCCAAEADQLFLEKLRTQLAPQEQEGTIKLWDQSQIPMGAIANREIRQHLASASIFLLLISPDFLADKYCSHTVMKAALRRHEHEEAVTVIPVIVRPADWQNIRILKDIRVFPRNGPPINGLPDQEQDHALWKVATEIKGVTERLRESPIGLNLGLQGVMSSSTGDLTEAPQEGMSSSTSDSAQASARPRVPSDQPQQPPPVRGGNILTLIFTRRWGWALIGLLVLLTGVLWGASSPTVPYIARPRGSNTPFYITATKSGDVYIYNKDTSTFFIARHDDFSPPIDRTTIHLDTLLDFVARSDTIAVNDTIERNLHVTQAHVIEKLMLYDLNSRPLATYTVSNYNPSGHYDSRWWPIAAALITVGLLIVFTALCVGRGHRKGA